jgi:DNA-binding NarL/FixJ family response regulator
MQPVRVLVVDDHDLVRAGIRALLDKSPDINVVGEAGGGREALRLIGDLDPDVVLLDISLPELNGLEVAEKVRKEFPRTRILFLSMHANEEYVAQALKVGAVGYVLKRATTGELEFAIRSAKKGEIFLSPAISNKVLADYVARLRGDDKRASDANPYDKLTARQREILQLIAEGRSTKEIARTLQVSFNTVAVHRAHLMKRLDIHDLAGLVRYAIQSGIIASDGN